MSAWISTTQRNVWAVAFKGSHCNNKLASQPAAASGSGWVFHGTWIENVLGFQGKCKSQFCHLKTSSVDCQAHNHGLVWDWQAEIFCIFQLILHSSWWKYLFYVINLSVAFQYEYCTHKIAHNMENEGMSLELWVAVAFLSGSSGKQTWAVHFGPNSTGPQSGHILLVWKALANPKHFTFHQSWTNFCECM